MTEIRLDCPHCKSKIIVKVQSEVYSEESGYETTSLMQRLGKTG